MKKNKIKKIMIVFAIILISIILLIFVSKDHINNSIIELYITNDDKKITTTSEKIKNYNIIEKNPDFLESIKNDTEKNISDKNKILYDKSDVDIEFKKNENSKEVVEMELYSYIEEVINIESNDDLIYGVALIPDIDNKKFPLVIMSHGLGGSHINLFEYAEYLVTRGIAVYLFDFTKTGNLSTGDTKNMSVITEVDDLTNILNHAVNWNFVDKNNIFLMGLSQGGLVSAIVAGDNEEKVAGLILCYPAFSIIDKVKQEFSDIDNLDDNIIFEWTTVGKKYITDIMNYNIYEKVLKYTKKVLIIHGDLDLTVPIEYSKSIKNLYKNCDLKIIHRAAHIFKGSSFDKAIVFIIDYLKNHNINI